MSPTHNLPWPAPEPHKTLRILVVDDDDVDREHLTRLLKQQVFSPQITEANSKQSALEAITQQRFDIVFLDFTLGDGDGRDLLPFIKEHGDQSCVVVGITAGGNERIAANAIKSGLHEYLPKTDLDAARLQQTITDCMHLAAVQAKLRDAAFQLQRRSMYDTLTGLPNRNLFFDRLEQSCATYQRQQTAFAVLMLDLDGFKTVNDGRGHSAGDEVLHEVGARFASVMRASGTMARIGGDEFAAILPGVATAEVAHTIAEKLLKTLDLPIVVAGHALSVGVSIGIALCPQNGSEAPVLMARADHAMYEAKTGLTKIVHHIAEEKAERTRKPTRALLVELERAIRENELIMHYQPKVRLDTREIVGFEALVRWNHPRRGQVPPGAFMSAIESSPLLGSFTHKTIDLALSQLKRWRAQSPGCQLSVNISARMLEEPWFVDRILEQLAQHGATPRELKLEINETALVVNRAKLRIAVEQLREAEIGLVADDFGAGFTSFACLKEFGMQEIKLDHSFVTELRAGSFEAALVQGLCVLCETQHIDLVAQGVETAEAGARLQTLGCRLGQGYAIAPPMPASELPDWLQSWPQAVTAK
jgi:diguanylate cyclase